LNKTKQNHALHGARLALVIAGSFGAADAREARSSFTVGATVTAVARIETRSEPAELLVSAADVRRGYVDVVEPTALLISSNSPTGFALELLTVTPMLSAIIVHGLASEQSLGAEGGTVIQRWQNGHTAALSLRFRLVLAGGLTEGHYPWPMRISVRPLDSA
jgi:hypothetical protein